ncbi:MFS general substrate transporter [Amniculicola lignicola CBS 123094]|uniref:MFS general substrate transporter n=1 Tax=Amniculicola lignicola CBS 123094 TaxID=1392246 RepID=A0A6A5VUE1_9PLEO|nr:MFS general substrate transporter [Amniculicola lignicola CBS 123094]
MSTPSRANGDNPSERTPLLSGHPQNQAVDEATVPENNDSAVVEGIPGDPEPGISVGLGQRRGSYKSYLDEEVEDEETEATAEQEGTSGFGDDGLLKGISKAKFRFIFGGILLGYTAATFDSTLMFSSHPVITSYFNASNSASWLSTSFLLTSTSLQPLFGRVSDTIGRRPLYLAGLVILAAATAWCAAAQSIGSFIAARAFCGVGAAGVMAMGSILTNDLVSIRVRGKYQAYINLFYGGGSACGAAFGGFLCDRIGWRMTFALQVPVLVALFVNAVFTTPSDIGPQLAKRSGKGIKDAIKGFDLAGSALSTTSVAFLILGLNLGGNVYPWKHPLVISPLVIAVVCGSVLIRVEKKAERPVMPLGMLSSRPRGNLVFNNFFAQIGINTIFFNIPLYFQAVKLETPSMSGFRLAVASVALTVCGVSAGFIMTATGRMKWLIVVGSLSLLMGGLCLSSLWNGIPSWLATIFIVPAAIGQGLSFPATSLAVLATSTQEDQAVMQSTLNLWRSLGVVMGVSFSSLMLQNALTVYLNSLVTGKHKDEIILTVRKSVRSIIDLDPKHQSQVIDAYNRSLKVTFMSAIAMFVIANVLVFAIKLPNIKPKEEDRERSAIAAANPGDE